MNLKTIDEIKEEGLDVFMPSGIQATLFKEGKDIIVQYPNLVKNKYNEEDFNKLIQEGIFIFSNQPTIAQQSVLMEDFEDGKMLKNIEDIKNIYFDSKLDSDEVKERLEQYKNEHNLTDRDIAWVIGEDSYYNLYNDYDEDEEYDDLDESLKEEVKLNDISKLVTKIYGEMGPKKGQYNLIQGGPNCDFGIKLVKELTGKGATKDILVAKDKEELLDKLSQQLNKNESLNEDYACSSSIELHAVEPEQEEDMLRLAKEIGNITDLEKELKRNDIAVELCTIVNENEFTGGNLADLENAIDSCYYDQYDEVIIDVDLDEWILEEDKLIVGMANVELIGDSNEEDLDESLNENVTSIATDLRNGNKSGTDKDLGHWLLKTSLDNKWEVLTDNIKYLILFGIADEVENGNLQMKDFEQYFDNSMDLTKEDLQSLDMFKDEEIDAMFSTNGYLPCLISYQIQHTEDNSDDMEESLINNLVEKGYIRESLANSYKNNIVEDEEKTLEFLGLSEDDFKSKTELTKCIEENTEYKVVGSGDHWIDIENKNNERIRINLERKMREAFDQENCKPGDVFTGIQEKPLEYLTPEFKNELLNSLDKIAREYPDVHVRQQAVTFMDELGLQEYYDTKAVEEFIKEHIEILNAHVNESKDEQFKVKKNKKKKEKIEDSLQEEKQTMEIKEDCYKVYNTLEPEAGYVNLDSWEEVDAYLNMEWGEYKASMVKENPEFGTEEDKQNFFSNFEYEIAEVPVVVEEPVIEPVSEEPIEVIEEEPQEVIAEEPIEIEVPADTTVEIVAEPETCPECGEAECQCEKVCEKCGCTPCQCNPIEEGLEEQTEEEIEEKEEIEEPEQAAEVVDKIEDELDSLEDFIQSLLNDEEEAESEEEHAEDNLEDEAMAECMEGPKSPEDIKISKEISAVDGSEFYIAYKDGKAARGKTEEEAKQNLLNEKNEDFKDNMGMLTDINDLDFPDALANTVETKEDGSIYRLADIANMIKEMKEEIANLKADFKSALDELKQGIKDDVKDIQTDVTSKLDNTDDKISELTAEEEEIEAEEEPIEEEPAEETEETEEEQVEESLKEEDLKGNKVYESIKSVIETSKHPDKLVSLVTIYNKLREDYGINTNIESTMNTVKNLCESVKSIKEHIVEKEVEEETFHKAMLGKANKWLSGGLMAECARIKQEQKNEELNKVKSAIDKLHAQNKDDKIKSAVAVLADNEQEAQQAIDYALDKVTESKVNSIKESLLSTSRSAKLRNL